MIFALIAFGILTGFIAALFTFVSGAGLLLSFTAYVIGGMAGVAIGIFCALRPAPQGASKRALPQQSSF